MKAFIVLASAAGAAAGALGFVGVGVASADTSAAPDVVGMTYSDATSKIEDGGGTAKVTVTVGDREDAMGDCLVTSATKAPFVEDSDGAFTHVDNVILVSLNCDRGVANATTPGASMGSPDGKAFQAKAEEAAKKQQDEADAAAAKKSQ